MEEVVLSNCCGAEVVYDDICSECLEHCELVIELHPSSVVDRVCRDEGE